ncbi:RNA polymerase sigma factor [Tamaricihabitans halophyticus]|uniref:RNA polymerase sigma factor n=1 Tax=Tamaricihabitans halophyticus TaxID=1262583 RepID=UPI001404384E|nr:sigma-70 family RNA polymerase sigma factor [Tamaricihabitans halophyticus]
MAERTANGESSAFSALHERYFGPICRMAMRMLGDQAEAEDITQEVFLIAWRRIGDLDEPGAIGGWLYRVARRRCLLAIRLARRQQMATADDLSGGHPVAAARSVDPVARAEIEACARDLERELAELTRQQQAVWLLVEVDGFSYVEVAQALGLSQQAVRSTMTRIRTQLAKSMRAWR